MKHRRLLAFLICLLPLASQSADPIVIVQSATRVTVDGTDYGKPADAIANNKQLAPLIQSSLEKYTAQIKAEKTESQTELADLKQRIDFVLQAKLTEELKTGDGPRAQIIRDLIKESSKSAAQTRLEAALAAKAAADKALAEAQKEVTQ